MSRREPATAAIVEEGFSIWRLFRALRGRPVEQDFKDSREADPQEDEPSTGPDRSADEEALNQAAALGAPSLLSGFNYSVTNCTRSDSGHLWVEHLLVCGQCIAGDMFSILSSLRIAPDPSPYDGVGPGETIRLPPWTTRCLQCGHETTIVEAQPGGPEPAREEGYLEDELDGETGATMVYVSLIYPPELGQLIDAATRANRPPADLFEALRMVGVSPHFETVFDELHESEI